MAAQTTSAQWPLAARDDQLEAFERLWALRSCRGVVVAGPAGVGKSRLAEECLARAVRAGFTGRRITASRSAARMPLGAVAHLIPVGVDMSDPVRGFAQIARALAGPGRDRRWAVLVDDVQLLDAASAVLLAQLMDDGRVRLIATLRTGERVSEAVAALGGYDTVGRIDLGAFDAQQTEAVLEAALGGPVGRRTVDELFRRSAGNALYLHELVLGALGDGSLSFDGEIWQGAEGRAAGTPRLGELISTRLATADPQARELLELLALCEPLPLADAEAAAGAPQILVGLEEAGLIQVRTDRRRCLVWLAHPLYGETLRAQLPVLPRRRLLLEQTARTEACGARRREDTVHIAAWRLAATGTADPAQLIRAAAIARYAHDYPQALTLLEALPDAERTTATGLIHGEVLFEVGRPDDAEQLLGDVDTRAESEPEVLAVTMARTVSLFWSAGRSQEALQINDAARARVASEQGRRLLRNNEGSMRIPSGEPARGLALLDDLTDDIRDDADPLAWLAGASMKPVGLQMAGRIGEAVVFAEHAHASHRRIEDRALYPHPASQLISVSYALRDYGRLAQAREAAQRGYAELTATSIPVPPMWMATILGELEWLAGHLETARRWFAEAADRARRHHNRRTLNPALCGLAASAAVLGEPEVAERALAEARTAPPLALFMAMERSAPAWLAAARGDLARARRLLTEGAAQARTAGMIPAESWLLADVARLGGAHQVAERLAELARTCDGTLVPARAHLAAALAADDPDQLLHTADELETIGTDLLAAEASAAAAFAYRHAGQARKATAATRLADACAARCEGARTPLLSAGSPTTAPLTTRERDVARLAAHGTPNQNIAATLHLSLRTVESHLHNAYAKLGITGRTELAHALDSITANPQHEHNS